MEIGKYLREALESSRFESLFNAIIHGENPTDSVRSFAKSLDSTLNQALHLFFKTDMHPVHTFIAQVSKWEESLENHDQDEIPELFRTFVAIYAFIHVLMIKCTDEVYDYFHFAHEPLLNAILSLRPLLVVKCSKRFTNAWQYYRYITRSKEFAESVNDITFFSLLPYRTPTQEMEYSIALLRDRRYDQAFQQLGDRVPAGRIIPLVSKDNDALKKFARRYGGEFWDQVFINGLKACDYDMCHEAIMNGHGDANLVPIDELCKYAWGSRTSAVVSSVRSRRKLLEKYNDEILISEFEESELKEAWETRKLTDEEMERLARFIISKNMADVKHYSSTTQRNSFCKLSKVIEKVARELNIELVYFLHMSRTHREGRSTQIPRVSSRCLLTRTCSAKTRPECTCDTRSSSRSSSSS